ncbi:MAG: helix-turn-helix transcriptional regulator [Bacteroidaceae bacterium]|nr:helix-turn-helix transcriptional regulator [Bacteroidaceae bacterium]
MNERERIEFIMNGYGLSSSQFADKTGIPRASVSHILSGRNKPSLEVLQKVAAVFPEIDIQWLMLGVGQKPDFSQVAMGESSQTPNEETVTVEEANLFMQYNEPVVRQQAKQPVIQPVIQPERQRSEDSRQQKVVSKAPQQAQRRVPQQRNNVEQVRRIKEIRVFYSDGTYEILYPEK